MKKDEKINESTQICKSNLTEEMVLEKLNIRKKIKLNLSFKAYTKINSKLKGALQCKAI